MADYRVLFFNNLVTYGKPFKCLQRAITVSSAKDAGEASEKAKREFERLEHGIEVFYPHDNELHVSRKSGKLIFDGDFGPRPHNSGDLMWPPFRSFGQDYYTLTSCCSI
jgi:hypothetical protein